MRSGKGRYPVTLGLTSVPVLRIAALVRPFLDLAHGLNFHLRALWTVVGFPIGFRRLEVSAAARFRGLSLGEAPDRSDRAAGCCGPDEAGLVVPGADFGGEFELARVPLSVAA